MSLTKIKRRHSRYPSSIPHGIVASVHLFFLGVDHSQFNYLNRVLLLLHQKSPHFSYPARLAGTAPSDLYLRYFEFSALLSVPCTSIVLLHPNRPTRHFSATGNWPNKPCLFSCMLVHKKNTLNQPHMCFYPADNLCFHFPGAHSPFVLFTNIKHCIHPMCIYFSPCFSLSLDAMCFPSSFSVLMMYNPIHLRPHARTIFQLSSRSHITTTRKQHGNSIHHHRTCWFPTREWWLLYQGPGACLSMDTIFAALLLFRVS